jgi:hypothetical protein
MSDQWRVFSSIAFEKMSELEEACDRLVDAYLLRHPGSKDTFGELSASKGAPKEKDARAAYEEAGIAFPPEMKAALKGLKSTLVIDRPGDLDRDPLQVSVLGFVLSHAGNALVAFDAAPFRSADEVIVELAKKKRAAGFGEEAPPKVDRAADRGEGERAAESVRQILETFEAAEHNLDLQIDLKRILGASSTTVKRYVTLLVSQGAVDDAQAARSLGVPIAEAKKAREEVAAVTKAIRPPREHGLEGAAGGSDDEVESAPDE